MSPISAARASLPAARTEGGPRLRVRLGLALTGLVLAAVLLTALIVHISWMWTAARNTETVVTSLNTQTATAVRKELETTFRALLGDGEDNDGTRRRSRRRRNEKAGVAVAPAASAPTASDGAKESES